MESDKVALLVEVPREKKKAFQIKCLEHDCKMNPVFLSLMDIVLEDKFDRWESARQKR
jgi:hypothetical protein